MRTRLNQGRTQEPGDATLETWSVGTQFANELRANDVTAPQWFWFRCALWVSSSGRAHELVKPETHGAQAQY